MNIRVVVWIVVIVLGGGSYFFWQQRAEKRAAALQKVAATAPAPPKRVIVAEIQEREFADRVEALGTIRADESIEITANVTDTIEELHFEDGQLVKRGDLLAKLKQSEEQALLEGARATREEQQREITRLEGLVKDGAVPEVRLEEYRTRRQVAEERVREIEAMLEDRIIRAPFGGQLGIRRVSPGALVSPGAVVTTLDALETVKLDFTVPETFLSEVEPGLKIRSTSAAYPGEAFVGEISHVDPRVNPVTRSVTVRALLKNPDLKLRPGMLMQVNLNSSPRMSPGLPERALISRQQTHSAFTVEEAGGDLAAKQVPIKVGARVPGYVEVREGLRVGQRVVTDGLLGLGSGARVVVEGEFDGPTEPYNPVAPTE